MTANLLIDLVIVFWLLLFGGMALLPIITGSTTPRQQRGRPVEDRVISIQPARPNGTGTPALRTPPASRDEHHDRPAA